jgi:integrase
VGLVRWDQADPIVLTKSFNASSATSALSALGSGMIAFTGFVTSVVLLLVQFGTSEFSPRFVAWFRRDRDPGDTGITVAAWLDTWLAGKRRAKKASTYRGMSHTSGVHIVPVIGDLPLERLNAGHVEQLLAAVPGSPATRHRVYATLSSAMSAAVRQRMIRFSPCAGIELEPENPAEAQRWTPEQARRFITFAADDRLGLAYRIMVLRGPRRAELCGLRWAGADLDAGYLTVARPIVQLGGTLHEETGAKSEAGNRKVLLDGETVRLLRRHREAQDLERMLAGEAWEDNDLIFCRDDGTPWRPDHVSKHFKKLAAQAGVPVIKLHEGGRHSANSLMRDAGIDQEVRMREVGHAGKDVNDRYTHLMEETHRAAAEQTASYVLGEDPS